MSVCGGRAQCGKCAVRIVRGVEYLTKKRAVEAIGADTDVRLACQTYTRGDVEIEILNMDETSP
jgi:ferredoxin